MNSFDFLDYINVPANWYLANNRNLEMFSIPPVNNNDVILYQVERLRDSDINRYLSCEENVLHSLWNDGIILVYIVYGDGNTIRYYYGIANNVQMLPANKSITLSDACMVFKETLTGNFPEIQISPLNENNKKYILSKVKSMRMASVLEGVPGLCNSKTSVLGADDFYNVANIDEFMLISIAVPLNIDKLTQHEIRLNLMKNYIAQTANKLVTSQDSHSNSSSFLMSRGQLCSQSNSLTNTEVRKEEKYTARELETQAVEKSTQLINLFEEIDGDFVVNEKERQKSISNTGTHLTSSNKNLSQTLGKNKNSSTTITIACPNFCGKMWMDYFDEVLCKRVDYCKGAGAFINSSILMSNKSYIQHKLSAAYNKMYNSQSFNRIPMKCENCITNDPRIQAIKNFQIPLYHKAYGRGFNDDELLARSAFSHVGNKDYIYGGNLISSKELSSLFAISANKNSNEDFENS